MPLLFAHPQIGAPRFILGIRSYDLIGLKINGSKITHTFLFDHGPNLKTRVARVEWFMHVYLLKTRGLFCLRVDRVQTPVLGVHDRL